MSKITPWPFSPGIIGRREDGPYVWHTAQWRGEEREFASYEGAERWLLRCKAREQERQDRARTFSLNLRGGIE